MNIGLFFGSFNPIHIGHLIIASYMLEEAELDEIWFVVSPQNPFKKGSDLMPQEDRLEMVQIAVKNHTRLKASDIEFSLNKPSYTIHTLEVLISKFPEHNFKIIMGSDNLVHFTKWKGYEDILNQAELLVYYRNGFTNEELSSHPNIKMFDAPVLNISATYIRDLLNKGKSIHYLVLPEVEEFLLNKNRAQKN